MTCEKTRLSRPVASPDSLSRPSLSRHFSGAAARAERERSRHARNGCESAHLRNVGLLLCVAKERYEKKSQPDS